MGNKRFSAILLVSMLMLMVMITVSACKKGDKKTDEKDATMDQGISTTDLPESSDDLELTEVEAEFILVSETDGKLLIYYNLNQLDSIDALGEFIDLGYDFDNRPEVFVEFDDVSEDSKGEITEILDEKNVRYTIIEDY